MNGSPLIPVDLSITDEFRARLSEQEAMAANLRDLSDEKLLEIARCKDIVSMYLITESYREMCMRVFAKIIESENTAIP